jgi:glucokinase
MASLLSKTTRFKEWSKMALGVDAGGTKLALLFEGENGGEPDYRKWLTSDFSAAEDLLARASSIWGELGQVVIAAAGRTNRDGSIQLTNVRWPVFRPRGERVVNDVECAAGAVSTLGDDEIRDLNGIVASTSELVAVTISTGDNSAFRDGKGEVHPAETGHIGWQPWYDSTVEMLARELLRFLQDESPGNAVITVEDVISGDRGFSHLYDFVSMVYPPGQDLAHRIEQQPAGKGIGPLITEAALNDDPCAVMCMQLWGPILGQYLRGLALSHLPRGGTIWLYGGVAEGDGVMDFVINHTGFTRHFTGGSAKMRDLMEQIALRQVVTSASKFPFTVRGALELAKTI